MLDLVVRWGFGAVLADDDGSFDVSEPRKLCLQVLIPFGLDLSLVWLLAHFEDPVDYVHAVGHERKWAEPHRVEARVITKVDEHLCGAPRRGHPYHALAVRGGADCSDQMQRTSVRARKKNIMVTTHGWFGSFRPKSQRRRIPVCWILSRGHQ